MGRVRVGKEVGYDGGLDDDLAVVAKGRYQAPGVDREVFWGARGVEVDGHLLKGHLELVEGNVGTVGPGTPPVGVEDELVFGGSHFCSSLGYDEQWK